ncbi:A/G-specific adenine glycosylase [Crocinitomix algicola]|uniref:A/G-specific adenine glycosylase n=1 Tax=Crocinitomix algicola TaxID=1740263 RepID=UPI000831DB65|nr:A/G-specific adenine glycosylase [Crocinitomix algicola]
MADFSSLIREWFRQNSRDLPWRKVKNPYAIWLSEVILQQTRVDQGLNYYLKFTKHFPSVKDLAMADEDEVLNLWQGLGYYSRARNLHAAAKFIHTQYSGIFPNDYKRIRELKGVGDYTAAAISSFAFNLPYAVVDGNVYRVLSRYLGISTPIDSTIGKKEFAAVAQDLLSKEHPAEHNQAIMELGALVCSPKKPQCDECPLYDSCFARQNNSTLDYPIKLKKTKVKNRFIHYLVHTNGEYIHLKKRTGKGIWQGLYDFPAIELDKKRDLLPEEIAPYPLEKIVFDGNFQHILSHQKLNVTFWILWQKDIDTKEGVLKIKVQDIEDYPMPQLLIRYIKHSALFNRE